MYSDDTFYIVFRDAERKKWHMRWLKEGFSHCFVLRADRGIWLKYESGHGITRIDTINDYANLIDNCIIVKVTGVERRKWLILNTCVSLVKLITGVGRGAFTPYQLYKKVIQ